MGVAAALVVGAIALGNLPTATKQGVNFRVSARRIPLHVKAIDFLQRHYQYQLLAEQITAGCRTDAERSRAVFAWTRNNIRETPKGWPVVDDHISHIIIRGYGVSDQAADVFTTLLTYAGVPAFWKVLGAPGTEYQLILSFARVDGRWAVFDVWNGLVFRDAQGRLASAQELAADPALVRATAGDRRVGTTPYSAYFPQLASLTAPRPLRPEMQMPGPRIWYEARRMIGLERQHGS